MWIPAFAGMSVEEAGMTVVGAGFADRNVCCTGLGYGGADILVCLDCGTGLGKEREPGEATSPDSPL